jgi:hypothetical protein
LSVQTASRLFSRNVQLFSVIPAKTGICSVPDETTDSCFRRNDRELEKVAHGVIFPFLYVFHVDERISLREKTRTNRRRLILF